MIEVEENDIVIEILHDDEVLQAISNENNVVEIALSGAQGIQGVQGEQGIQGEKGDKGDKGDTSDLSAEWIGLATGWKTTPSFNSTIAAGDVWDYVFETAGGDVTYYRLVPSPYVTENDAFYDTFSGGNLSGLIVSREIEA